MNADESIPLALMEMLFRFYGWGAERDFSGIWDIYSRRPYDPLLRELQEISNFEDYTDPNDEVSFSFATAGWVVRLSMVGPYAVVLEGPDYGPWHPVASASDSDVGAGINVVRAAGFQLFDRQMLGRIVPIWEEKITVYSALFVNDDRLPWD